MNQSCLYCCQNLEVGQIDFHRECAIEFFGCETPSLNDNFVVKHAIDGYNPLAEALILRLAKAAMILTEPSSLFRVSQDELVLAMRRDQSAENLTDLVARLEGCEFDGSVEMIAELVEDFSSISRLDVVNLFEQVLFGWIMGCSSMGLASFALLHPHDGVWSLSPLFDVTPTLLLEGSEGKEEFSVSINNKRRNIHRSDFEAAMRQMGLKDRIIRITIEKMINSQTKWTEIINSAPLSEELKEGLIKLISVRITHLQRR